MRIRTKILLACLSLTLVTLVLGMVSREAQSKLGQIAVKLYDEAFMSMSYLRSAQNTLLTISRDVADDPAQVTDLEDRVESALGDLDVAEQRALSPQGFEAAHALKQAIAKLGEDWRAARTLPSRSQLSDLEARFDVAVEINAGDGFHSRRVSQTLIDDVSRRTWAVMGASIAIALAITFLLSRAIVPALQHAVGIATAIAGGRLDNKIAARGKSETSLLLRALAVMQKSIAGQIARIEELMAQQAVSHASEMASQHERFETALDNMAQGLCMSDAQGRVLVHNRRFAEMFGAVAPGSALRDVLPPDLIGAGRAQDGDQVARTFTRNLADNRIITVVEKAMGADGWVTTYEDVTERHRIEARIAHMARHDALTGLPNRVQFREQMEPRLAQVRRGGALAVLCLDLDRFKHVNDTLGHQVGDDLLRAVAQRLLDATRKSDLVVRLGGDEFAIIQSSAAQPTEAQALADRLIGIFAEPFSIRGHEIASAVSIGIALTNDGRTTADELLKSADLALHRAKVDGRGLYRFFEAEMDAIMQARRLLELDLRQAILERQFENFYQPLVDVQTRDICGFEALVRWRHPRRGMVPPGEFISLAEETGLIAQIGRQVLERACQDAVGLPSHIKVAVNLSPLQFRDPNLAREVSQVLQQNDLDPGRLELEITESLLLQDSEATLSILHQLRAIGVRISMDDFGTGYSSLSYLRRFPFDKIKVDQSFIRSLDDRSDCLAIVRAIIGLGKSLGMRVIAEGVETEQQLALLRREGCEQVQGYLFSKPQPLAAFQSVLQRAIPERPPSA